MMDRTDFQAKLDELTSVDDEVGLACSHALGAYYDGCHKIYLAMDDNQVAEFEGGYTRHDPSEMLLRHWWEKSCGLRFIEAVFTDYVDPNRGYVQIIEQFGEWP